MTTKSIRHECAKHLRTRQFNWQHFTTRAKLEMSVISTTRKNVMWSKTGGDWRVSLKACWLSNVVDEVSWATMKGVVAGLARAQGPYCVTSRRLALRLRIPFECGTTNMPCNQCHSGSQRRCFLADADAVAFRLVVKVKLLKTGWKHWKHRRHIKKAPAVCRCSILQNQVVRLKC